MTTATHSRASVDSRAGHEANGRFAPGNSGGPGNPFGRKMAANRDAILEVAGPEQIKAMMASLYERGIGGHIAAARLYMAYAVGKPQAPREPDLVDVEEFEVAKAKRVPHAEAVIAHIDMPVTEATAMAESTPPTAVEDAEEDRLDAEEEKAEAAAEATRRRGETYRLIHSILKEGKFPADSPFAPLSDGTDPKVVEEHGRMMDYFAKALREGKFPEESPFEALDDGGAAGVETAAVCPAA